MNIESSRMVIGPKLSVTQISSINCYLMVETCSSRRTESFAYIWFWKDFRIPVLTNRTLDFFDFSTVIQYNKMMRFLGVRFIVSEERPTITVTASI